MYILYIISSGPSSSLCVFEWSIEWYYWKCHCPRWQDMEEIHHFDMSRMHTGLGKSLNQAYTPFTRGSIHEAHLEQNWSKLRAHVVHS